MKSTAKAVETEREESWPIRPSPLSSCALSIITARTVVSGFLACSFFACWFNFYLSSLSSLVISAAAVVTGGRLNVIKELFMNVLCSLSGRGVCRRLMWEGDVTRAGRIADSLWLE